MVRRSHNEFQADSCFKIGDKFIAFIDKDSVVCDISELCGTIRIKCNENVNPGDEDFLSAQKR